MTLFGHDLGSHARLAAPAVLDHSEEKLILRQITYYSKDLIRLIDDMAAGVSSPGLEISACLFLQDELYSADGLLCP